MQKTYDLHVVETRPLISPGSLHIEQPITEAAAELVVSTRDVIRNILRDEDQRLLAIVGPCSVHDVKAALEYGEKLVKLRQELAGELEIVMRVYFEKPRTTVGWKGLINDPHLDGSYDINTGLRLARQLLLDLAHLGLPAATELLDPITPQYIADLIAWTAIGARTTESQTHRLMASGLSMPIGYKNGTDGSLTIASNAMLAASQPHHFLGINYDGAASIVSTTGNPDGHMVLRGGSQGPNYNALHVEQASQQLAKLGLNFRVMIDCSHGNSNKDFHRQANVLEEIGNQVVSGSRRVMGVMIESHLIEGSQPIPEDLSDLRYGQSITDPCVNFETTERILRNLARSLRGDRQPVH